MLLELITKAVNVHFNSLKGSQNLYIDGQPFDFSQFSSWAELRIVGPKISEYKNYYNVKLIANIMCSSSITTDLYSCQKIVDVFNNTSTINLTNGCLFVREDVEIINWGLMSRPNGPTPVHNISLDIPFEGDIEK